MSGEFSFHFGAPWWLLALLLILPVGIWLRRTSALGKLSRLKLYADPHLLPHLTGSRELQPVERWRRFTRWSILWAVLVIAMAGPRWDFTRVQLFSPGSDLVILLDISRSMEVADVQPSRLARARQEIEDLVNQNNGKIRLGLIAFASVAHVVAPITEDGQTIRQLLPEISSDLVRLQGSRLIDALDRAEALIKGQPEKSRHSVLLISDGDFADAGDLLDARVAALAEQGVEIHVLGVGTEGGGPVPATGGRYLLDTRRQTVESRLDSGGLEKLAELGKGLYWKADYRGGDTQEILQRAIARAEADPSGEAQAQVWNERFFLLLIPAMLALLPNFRRHRHSTLEVPE